jgi:hypothetical protein
MSVKVTTPARSPRKQIAILPPIHAKLEAIAKKNHRTITAQIEFWVENEHKS